jgi:ribosomal protein S18 acetylase RimI-like enzyme
MTASKAAPGEVVLREYAAGDEPTLIAFVAAIQDAERALHPSRRRGEDVAADYVAWLLRKCGGADGAIVIAEARGASIGFGSGWLARSNDMLQSEPWRRYGWISDVYVEPSWRRRGVAQRLLAALGGRLAQAGAERLRICSLADNAEAIAAWRRFGFQPFEVEFDKPI